MPRYARWLVLVGSAAVAACATSPEEAVTDEFDAIAVEPPPAAPMPSPTADDDGAEGAEVDAGSTADAGAADAGEGDAGADAAGPESVTLKLVPTGPNFRVGSVPAFVQVVQDAKSCDLFGSCDANVEFKVYIDVPATSTSTLVSCSRTQKGTGYRTCTQGSNITKVATLTPGTDVRVRFHAEAVDDPGANPQCDIDRTWRYTGTGFTLQGTTQPTSGFWECTGSGSGQDLVVRFGYRLDKL